MNLYLVSQDVNSGYDTYDSMVVCAESESEARKLHPSGGKVWKDDLGKWTYESGTPAMISDWAFSPAQVTVALIGTASQTVEPGIVIASFNAG